jgi:hypothetical protein
MGDSQPKDGRHAIATICRRLRKLYGPVDWPEQGPILDELIATVLSQNTPDTNSGPSAFDWRLPGGHSQTPEYSSTQSCLCCPWHRTRLHVLGVPRANGLRQRRGAQGQSNRKFLKIGRHDPAPYLPGDDSGV